MTKTPFTIALALLAVDAAAELGLCTDALRGRLVLLAWNAQRRLGVAI